jgi:hypothetical protein
MPPFPPGSTDGTRGMHATSHTLCRRPTRLLKAALLTGAIGLAALATSSRTHAASGLCTAGDACQAAEHSAARYATALQRTEGQATAAPGTELTDQDSSAFSGIGVIACSVNGQTRSSTAFLVGAFDIGVTVAHTFQRDSSGGEAADCVYNSMDSLGQIRERIPVSYVKSQWDTEAGAAGEPAKDLAVVRLSKPSRYAQRTMPLGRFSGAPAQVVMVGYKSEVGSDTVKHKARGAVYERGTDGLIISSNGNFIHEMDSRDIAAGAPVIDESTGVIIGIHTRLAARRHAMITMNDWLETTLRLEMQAGASPRSN